MVGDEKVFEDFLFEWYNYSVNIITKKIKNLFKILSFEKYGEVFKIQVVDKILVSTINREAVKVTLVDILLVLLVEIYNF